ncbi:MAG: hypothetical protein HGA36_02775 [Candidatus Moranbacteria bacterium]|nr:hypothetical protein [Candidatus Moranbacteria bacterium]
MKKNNKNIIVSFLIAILAVAGFGFNMSLAAVAPQINISAYVVSSKNEALTNKEYDIRFAIYRTDRQAADAYPSDSDAGQRVWEETQKVFIRDGVLSAYLGSVVPFPAGLNFNDNEYYLGIRINTDGEIVPRKKIGSVPLAMDSAAVGGATLGTKEGNIAQLGKGGKFNIGMFPTGTGKNQLVLGNDSRFADMSNIHLQNSDTGSSELVFNVGDGSSLAGNNFDLAVGNSGNKPALRFDGGVGKWQYSNDGINFIALGQGNVDASEIVTGVLGAQFGGTGLTGFSVGDMLFANSTTSLGKLAIGNDGQVLSVVGGIPTWADVSGASPIKLLSAQHLDTTAADVQRGAIIAGQGASPTWSLLGPGTSGQILRSNGVGADLGWVTLSKNDVGLGNVENTALSTWVGSTNISTLGTITNGTWSGTMISAARGGTGNGTYVVGDILYATNSNTLSRLGVGIVGQALIVSAGGTPVWSSSVPTYPHDLLNSTEHPDTTTGAATRGDLIVGNSSNLWARLGKGASGNILTMNVNDVAWNSAAGLGLATLAGSESLTNKTMGSGSNWQGNAVMTTYGGTGIGGGYVAGDILYYSAGSALSRLARGANGTILSLSGGFPSWIATTGITTLGTITTGTWNGTVIDLAHGGTGAIDAAGARINLELGALSTQSMIDNGDWSGTQLAVGNGGTGTTNGSITGTGALSFAAGGASNNINLNPTGTGMVAVNAALGIKAGAYRSIFQGAGAQGADITYTLPAGAPGDDQFLGVNSSGILQWQSVSGVSGVGSVTSVGSGNGLAGGPITGAGTLSINLLSANDGTATTSSFSGLQFSGAADNQLALLQGCATNDVLAWNDIAGEWMCASVSGVGGLTGLGVAGQVTVWSDTDVLTTQAQLNVNQGGTGATTAANARTNLGLSIGTDVQAQNANLAAIAAGTWTGANSLTTLGTITTGAWHGGVVAPLYGGTGMSSYANGDLLYANGPNSLTTLAAGAGNIGNVLIVNGSGLPIWGSSAPTAAHTLLNALEHSDTTAGNPLRGDLIFGNSSDLWSRLAHGATGDLLTYNGADVVWNSTTNLNLVTSDAVQTLTNKTMGDDSDWQGDAITTTYGGTGLISFTAGDMLYYNAGVTLSRLLKGTDGQVLVMASGIPTWSSSAPGAAHNFLSSSHADTTATAVTRGAIIAGQGAAPTWSLLGPGTTGQMLKSNGNAADLSWVTLSKTDIGLGNVENTALSSWAGSSNISTLGTITSGTWNGTAMDISSNTNLSTGGTLAQLAGDVISIKEGTLNTGKLCTFITGTGLVCDTDSASVGHASLTFAGAYDYLSLSGQQITLNQIDLTTDVAGLLPTTRGGTGLNTSAATGVAIVDSGTWSIASSLGISKGGTNATAIGTAGTVAYSSGSAYAFSALGTAGQAMISGGTGAPTWFAPTAGSMIFAGTNGILEQDNANLFWNNTNKYLRLGASPYSMGVDTTDGNKFKIATGDGIAGSSQFTMDTNGVTSIANLQLGAQSFAQDSGVIAWTDMPVTSAATIGTKESYIAMLDGNPMLTIYGESDGAGGIQNSRVGIGTASPTSLLSVGATSQFQVNNAGQISTSGGINLTTVSGIDINFSGAAVAEIGTSGAQDFFINTNNTQRIGILANGNVGIGTTGPLSKLSIGDVGVAGAGIFSIGNTYGVYGQSLGAGSYGVYGFNNGNGIGGYFTSALGYALVTGIGNVGIGDATPASLFTVGASDAFQINNAGQVVAGAWNGAVIGSQYGGTGLNTSAATGVATVNSGTWSIAPSLGISKGGTATNVIGAPGSIAYSTGDIYAFSLSGTAGRALVSGGTFAPTWFAPTAGSMIFAGTNGILAQDNANLFWNNTNKYLRLGASPYSMGVDTTDGNKFKIFPGDGVAGTGVFSIGTDGVTSIASLSMGTQEFQQNSGIISWIDMPVTSASAINTVHSYTAGLDGNPMLTMYGKSDGGGGVTNLGVGIGTTSPLSKFDVNGSVAIGAYAGIDAAPVNGLIVSGNVGIGITAPTYKFMVDWNGDGTNAAYVNNSNAWTNGSADYAEYFYTKSIDLQSGDVVCVDTQNANGVKRCENSGDNNVMGIVSTSPSVLGNAPEGRENDKNYIITAMLGQVPGKVSSENGAIQIGDNLTSASAGGYMRKANAGEATVGIAMQNFADGKGIIQVLISRRNQSLTVEKVEQAVTENIASMNIQDQVTNIVSDAKIQLDAQLATQISVLDALKQQVADATTVAGKLQAQMDLLKEENQALVDFTLALNLKSLIYKDVAGNLDLLDGKLTAQVVESGKLVISVLDQNARTIGVDSITSIKKDDNADGKDDDTTSDGKTFFVKTTATNSASKVFITPKVALEQGLAVTEMRTGEGFVVTVKNAVTEDVAFDWVIMEEK